jgi:hypothetical protein
MGIVAVVCEQGSVRLEIRQHRFRRQAVMGLARGERGANWTPVGPSTSVGVSEILCAGPG